MKVRPTLRYVHQLMIIAIILSSGLIPSGFSTFTKQGLAQSAADLVAAKTQVLITANGFSPSHLTILAGNEIE